MKRKRKRQKSELAAVEYSPRPVILEQAKTPAVSGSRLQRFWSACVDPIDALNVRIFESLFTATFLIWMGRCLWTWEEWLTSAGFHLTAEELKSMGYPSPWPLLQPWQVPLFAFAIFGSGFLIMCNRWRRIALITAFVCALYAQRVDYMAAFTLNKLFVGVFAILALAPGFYRDKESGKLMQSAAPLRVLQATLVLQYFAAGLAKVDGDWLKSKDVLWGHVQGNYRTIFAAFALRHFPKWIWSVQQYVSLAFEVLAPVWFLVPKLRPVAFVLGIGFHVVIALMMKDLIYFSVQMFTFYALFITSDEWRAIGGFLKRFGMKLGVTAHMIPSRQTADHEQVASKCG